METKFEIGDVVSLPALGGEEYTVTSLEGGPFADHIKLNGCYLALRSELTLVRRASAQREGGFGWTEESRNETHILWRHHDGREVVAPIDEAPDRDWPHYSPQTFQLGRRGFRWMNGAFGNNSEAAGYVPADSYEERVGAIPPVPPPMMPPQPAPMTRAARVLAKMERDPYEGNCRSEDHDIGKEMRRLDSLGEARLRMAKMSLDRPLDAERARWERLVCAVNPVTSRAVRGRR